MSQFKKISLLACLVPLCTSVSSISKEDDFTITQFITHPLVPYFAAGLCIGVVARMGAVHFQNSQKSVSPSASETNFTDVIGADKAKQELQEIANIIKNPEYYTKIGAHLPKGILLTGAPGNGKTLLARALASEAKIPFYAISASEIQADSFIATGVRFIKNLFKQARDNAPAIIFIDEFDAIGSRDNLNSNPSNQVYRNNLNQLLVELDGIQQNNAKPIIIIAATNHPQNIDKALLRSGRFDQSINVPLPDEQVREQMLQFYGKKLLIDTDINYKELAQKTADFSGADIANLMNRAAIIAARRKAEAVGQQDCLQALDDVMHSKKNNGSI